MSDGVSTMRRWLDRKRLRRRLAFLSLIGLLGAFHPVHACERKTISIPVSTSELVFHGRDEDMPLNGCYWFAVDDRDMALPRGVDQAVDKMISIMPRWMRVAVQEGRGINACVVVVNNVDYLNVLIRAYVERWHEAGVDMSGWRKGPAQKGFISDPVVEHLQERICLRLAP